MTCTLSTGWRTFVTCALNWKRHELQIRASGGDAIKLRGGSGQNINKVADWLKGKSVSDVANQAAQGDAEAKTAIKILKEAHRLSEKY